MGNLIQCCRTLSNYFKCEDALVRGEAERSPLLSSEDSECYSLTLPDNLEEDMLTVSTTAANSLEPEHFLFPDIILSSHRGGDVALVEPMVCLLVSEEEAGGAEGLRMEEPGEGGAGRFSEVETQTEHETQMGSGVRTPTDCRAEVQTQTEISSCDAAGQDEEGRGMRSIGAGLDVWEDRAKLRQADERPEAYVYKRQPHDERAGETIETGFSQPTQRDGTDSQTRSETDGNKMKMDKTPSDPDGINKEEVTEKNLSFDSTTQTAAAEESAGGKDEKLHSPVEHGAAQENADFVCTSQVQEMDKSNVNSAFHKVVVSQSGDRPTGRDSDDADSTPMSADRFGRPAEVSDNEGDEQDAADTTAKLNLTVRDTDWIQSRGVSLSEKRSETEPCLRRLSEQEGEAEIKQVTLFLVDKLFLTAPHLKGPPCQEDQSAKEEGVDEEDQLSIREIVDLQETHFAVRIQPPGSESFELQVSGQMLVAELQRVLMDHELTCHRTCFSLQLGGVSLDGLRELRSVEGIQGGEVIKIVEDSYSTRDARLHLRHVRDLLRSLDPTDAYNGMNGSSLSYLSYYTRGGKGSEHPGRRRMSERECFDCSPPEHLLPGCKDRPLAPLQPLRADWKPLQCLRVLTMSSWNPPPGNRKMHGDLMYLNVLTVEDKELNITCSTRGFYLNQSTAFNFNPKPRVPKILCHTLVELLSQISPVFKKNFSALQKKRVQQHPYERMAAPFPVFTWIAPHGDHALDYVRAEETHTSHMGQDEHTAGQSRDWNEELQGSRELPRNTLQERLTRERSVFKTYSEFVGAAGRGAVAVVDGNVMPLNPGESPHMQMFIWNNIFFSLGFDISEHFQPLGGNTAAHAAAIRDLRGAQVYTSVDTEGLHTLGTAVVDYRGIRVIAQTIVPGILDKSEEQSVIYGSNDYGKTVFTHPRFAELLNKTSKPLRIQHHLVLDHNNTPVELCCGIETKGILGNDGRAYILDLIRTFPPDLNFQFSETQVRNDEVPLECQSSGFPRQHHHNLASLRPELMEAFVQHRYEIYAQMVSLGLSQENKQKEEDAREATQDKDTKTEQPVDPLRAEEAAGSAADSEPQRKKVTLDACKAVGSVSDSGFDIRFNPNICSPGVSFPSSYTEEIQKQRQLLWDAAAFLLSDQISAVLKDCLDNTIVPMDGATMTLALHRRGVNVRYLGALLMRVDKVQEGERLSHIQRIAICEIIIRSAKHIFRTYLQGVELAAFSAAVSHFLNCLLSSSTSFPESSSDELLSRRRSRKRRSHWSRGSLSTGSTWAKLTSGELWARIRTEAADYYHYAIQSESIDEVIEKYSLQKISLLREISIKTGIQVQMKEYVFESRHRPVFGEEDIVNIFPVIKHLKPEASDATHLLQRAQAAVQEGLLREGYQLIGQALTLFTSICGVLHEDVCMCHRLLGRLSYILGDHADALSQQEKAVLSSERIQGIDHPQTIHDYTFLALYCFAGGQHATSLQLLYRARFLTLIVSGEDHPYVALLDSMVGLVLYGLREYELSLKFLRNALNLTAKYHGATSLKHAHGHHVLATVYESKGEFRSALQHEKEAYSIYKDQVGDDHDSTKESSEYLKSLTQQAVILQKSINHMCSDAPSASFPPPKFSVPSFPTILQQLNLTCGIILISLSAKEVADLRTELRGKEKFHIEVLENVLSAQKIQ